MSSLSSSAVRALSARSYEKRKNGALEIETMVRTILADAASTSRTEAGADSVKRVVRKLANDFIVSKSSHSRKGGLIGLAAVALGCSDHDVAPFLQMLLPPVLRCFDDPDPRVRYYACEALFNVSKVARNSLLNANQTPSHFAGVFDGLCKLCADPDSDVKNGSMLLDRLLKEIVSESESFRLDGFVDDLIVKYLKLENPYVRQLLLGWISTLNSLPDVDFVARLPSVLDDLFAMLDDVNGEIREATSQVLKQFLSELKISNPKRTVKPDLVTMVDVLASRTWSSKQDSLTRITALEWLEEFIEIDSQVIHKTHLILKALFECLDTDVEDVESMARLTDAKLRETFRTFESEVAESMLVDLLIKSVDAKKPSSVRSSSLTWITMLLDKMPEQMLAPRNRTRLLKALLTTLHDSRGNAEVTLNALEALARVASDDSKPNDVLLDVLDSFESDRELMERRGGLVLRRLSVLLGPSKVFDEAARIVQLRGSVWPSDFSASLVRLLNLLLLTSFETSTLRSDLRANTKAFSRLFKAFSHSAVSVLSLCLIAQEYELASRVVSACSETEVDVEFLVGLDRTVQLLESPVFLNVRLALLKTGSDFEPYLLQTLYGILMLLPQETDAFKTLDRRLRAATSMHAALGRSVALSERHMDSTRDELLRDFCAQRARVFDERNERIKSESLYETGVLM